MAFLSLGLNIDEPQSIEQIAAARPEPDLSDDILCDSGPELDPTSAQESKVLVHVAKSPQNGANGSGARNDSEPTDVKKDEWPEMGMQIIQQVLRDAQSKATPAVAQSPEHISDLPPTIEELQKKILEGIIPDFRVSSKNGHQQTAASLTVESPSDPNSQLDPWNKFGDSIAATAPELLFSVIDELRKQIGQDEPASSGSTALSDAERARTWMSALVPAPNANEKTSSPDLPSLPRQDPQRKIVPEFVSHSVPPSVAKETQSRKWNPAPARTRSETIPSFTTFKFGYLPGRGLLYSIIGHEVAMFGIFLLITYGFPSFRSQKLIVGSQSAQSHLIYLPEVGGGAEGQKSPGGGRSKPERSSAAPARASKGFAYPGAQAILSDPPNPTNAFQTVLRPLMVHPEPLKKLVPLPNIVQMAETRLPSALLAPKAAMPQFHAAPQPIRVKRDSNLHRNAKWNVPVTDTPQLLAKAEMPKLAAAERPLPQGPKVEPKPEEQKKEVEEKPVPAPLKVAAEKHAEKPEKQAAPPSTAQVAKLEMHGKSAEPLLSLSPMPLPTGSKAKVPAGEARGKFAIAPGGTLNPNSTTPGKPNGSHSISPATGQENAQSANAATELAANTGNGAGHNPAAGGGPGNANESAGAGSAGTGSGSRNTAGAGVGGAGTGNGRGTAGAGAGKSGHGAGA